VPLTAKPYPRIDRVFFVRFVSALSLFAVLLAACADKKACKIHSDCSETERCVNFECTVLCRTDRDCEGLGNCIAGECSIFGTGGGFASGGGSGGGAGGGGGATDAGPDAGVDAGTPDAGIIDAGIIDAGIIDAGIIDAGIMDPGVIDAGRPDAGGFDAGVVDAGIEDAGNGMGQYGDACNRGGDCASTLCIGNAQTGLKMCTIACGSEAACDETHACLPVQSGSGVINICIPSDSGQSCSNGLGSGCIAGICLLHPTTTALSVCATPCETTRSCPSGFSCSVVQVGSGMQKVCSPVATSCSNANQCISRWCSTLGTAPSMGICTGNCSTASDCPAGWACGLADDGVTSFNRCQPIGMSCAVSGGNNDCYSQVCATGTPQGDYCVAFCMDANGNPQPSRCPATYTCVDEGTAGSPAWVCEK
jgi:hypothetical protein